MDSEKEQEMPDRLSPYSDGETVLEEESKEETECKPVETEGLSKRQQKRLKKHEKWLQLKAEKRKEEKQKKKRKFIEARERGDLGPSRKALKKNCMANSTCKQQVVIDCSFDEYMSEKDVRHLVQQIQHSYSANRRAENPLQFYVCGVNGKAQKRLEQIGDYKGWDVYFKSESYLDIFPKENIVYLSSDSPNVLDQLDHTKAYVIGGLVDHNHHKGLCHELAIKHKVSHAQLPITEYIDMKTRKVLTVNHVFEILLRYTETRDWKQAFFQVLPQRKGMKEKEGDEGQTGQGNEEGQGLTEGGQDQEGGQEDNSHHVRAESSSAKPLDLENIELDGTSVSEHDDNVVEDTEQSPTTMTTFDDDNVTSVAGEPNNEVERDTENSLSDIKKDVGALDSLIQKEKFPSVKS